MIRVSVEGYDTRSAMGRAAIQVHGHDDGDETAMRERTYVSDAMRS
jgi:hypothetical protein